MQLQQIVAKLETLDDEGIICVTMPWTATAESQVVTADENLGVPASVKASGYAYFLEVHIAREVLQVFGAKPASIDERTRLLIHYADNDAYPEWVYNR